MVSDGSLVLFSPEQDKLLVAAVKKFKGKKWKSIGMRMITIASQLTKYNFYVKGVRLVLMGL